MTEHKKLIFAVGKVLSERRTSLNVSQVELGKRSCLNRSYIGEIERGRRNLSLKNLNRLSEALGLKASKVVSLAEQLIAKNSIKFKRKPSAVKKVTARSTGAKRPIVKSRTRLTSNSKSTVEVAPAQESS